MDPVGYGILVSALYDISLQKFILYFLPLVSLLSKVIYVSRPNRAREIA